MLNAQVLACVFTVKALAAGGGIGGGGMLVPVFLLVAKAAPDRASPMSVVAIAGGAVANFAHYSRRRKADGTTLVDYRQTACTWFLFVRLFIAVKRSHKFF